VTKSSHLYQVPGKLSHFWKYYKKTFSKPGQVPKKFCSSHFWNVTKCDENVTSHHFRHRPSLKHRLTQTQNCTPSVQFNSHLFLQPSVQFNSHLFLSPIGARTLKMPVNYPPPSVGAYTRAPSHQPLVFGRKGTDHLLQVR